jgi:alpha-ketoglutarate-dependent taurine dioxygenase
LPAQETVMASKILPELRRVTSAIGAIIEGIDLRHPPSPDEVSFIRRALLDHGVVFFRDQEVTGEQMLAFVAKFGTPIPEPFGGSDRSGQVTVEEANTVRSKRATSIWHSDTSSLPAPPKAAALRAVRLPPVGGDTCWASMYAAYEALSEPMQRMLDGLTAINSTAGSLRRMQAMEGMASYMNEQVAVRATPHPVVVVHPDTGRKALFVNAAATTHIVELEPAESAHVLAMLFEHIKSPDFSLRWNWTPNDIAFWDNRATQHYAVPDYTEERIMQRIVLEGAPPLGPRGPTHRPQDHTACDEHKLRGIAVRT